LKFRGEAKYWWKSKKLHLTREYGQGVPIPWERFKREFNDYFSRDFQDLKQGTMSIEQYLAEFQKLSRYAPCLIPDEETKVERFRDGLAPRILERIIFVKVTNYTEMVHIATMAEKGIKTAATDYINRKLSMSAGGLPPPRSKRHAAGSNAWSYGRKNTSPSLGSGSPQRCSKCRKPYLGECRFRLGAC